MKVITLHIEESRDGETVFTEVADVLDAAADLFQLRDQNAEMFLRTRAEEARKIETIYEKREGAWR